MSIDFESLKAKAFNTPAMKDAYIQVLEEEMCRLDKESSGRLRALLEQKALSRQLEKRLNSPRFVRVPIADWQKICEKVALVTHLAIENAFIKEQLKAL